jgi:hypothetical protein
VRRSFASVAVVVGGALLLVLLALGGLVGVRAGGSDDEETGATTAVAVGEAHAIDERIDLDEEPRGFERPQVAIAGLVDGEARLLRVDGLPAGRAGTARQCAARSGGPCAPSIPLLADDDGRATFLFVFAADLGSGTDCVTERCVLAIDEGDNRQATLTLLFGEERRAGAIRIDRRTRLEDGEVLGVRLLGFDAGPATVTFCTPPGPSDPGACGDPAPEVVVDVGADGTGTAELPVHVGAVGRNGDDCRRGERCGVAVPARPDVAVVEVGFAGTADARPDRLQVVVGLVVAGLLVVAALVVLRRGRWTPPGGDPFEGVVLDDPFADIDLFPEDEGADGQPATSRRRKHADPATSAKAT